MSVAASQAPSGGFETLLAATPNALASKTPGSAATPPGQTASVPELFGQMLANEVEQQTAATRGAALESTATAAPTARASKKMAGGKSRLAAAADAPDAGQQPAAAGAAPVPTQNAWLPQGSQLAFAPAAASGSFSATGGTGGDGTADQVSTVSAGTNAEVATAPPVASLAAVSLPGTGPGAAAGPGQASGDHNLPGTSAGQPSNPTTEATPASAVEPAGLTRETRPAAAVLPAIAAVAPDATGSAAAGDAPHPPANAVSIIGQTPASVSPATTAPPSESTPETGPEAASLTQNRVELRAAETPLAQVPATEPPATGQSMAQAVGDASAAVPDTAASLFARLAAQGGGQTPDLEGAVGDQGATGVAGTSDRGGGDGLAEKSTLAFQALLVPASPTDGQFVARPAPDAGDASTSVNSTLGTGAGASGGRSGSPAPHVPSPGSTLAAQVGQASGTAQALAPAAANPDAGAAASQSGSRSHPAATASASPATASEAELAAAPKPAAGGAAREIHLELRAADARVDVRLVERAGSVQVDVRTHDSHLAASLRDDLPTLAARLEQTGLRTESWHDAPAAAAGRMRTPEASSTASAGSSENQSQREGGKNDRRDDQPGEKRQRQPSTESKEFTWLYTSLT